MKRIVLDTDIGVDCDDAVALALLMKLKKSGFCEILGVSTSTARVGATSAVRAILDYYGEYEIPCGRMYSPFLPCDYENNYAEKLMKKYQKPEAEEESVHLLRRTIAGSTEKISLVAIGPLTMIAKLLQSKGDEFSSLDGEELLREKVDAFYTMSCRFCGNDGEWNVVLDISAARYVFEHCPVPIVVSPGELGDTVFTGGSLNQRENHPVLDSLVGFFEEKSEVEHGDILKRESWDPLTCYAAVFGTEKFEVSEWGKVRVDERGVSAFTPCKNGNHRILRRAKNPVALGNEIDEYLIKFDK